MNEGRVRVSAPGEFFFRAHPRAPTFSKENHANAMLLVRQLINEVATGNFPSNAKFTELLSELGFVSIYFFLKFICGSSGPYNELNEDLHLEMCNFRQSDYCMLPGVHAACFVPRGFMKSTIMTHGGATWELLRNPNITILIVNAILDNAVDFKRNIMRTFDSNNFFADLYPEYRQTPNAPLWNEKVLVLPNRTRYRTEANVTAIGSGGAGEGKHYDLILLDDLVGLEDLDAEHMGNMDMEHKVQWFKTNTNALVRSKKRSRVLMSATRWSLDDPSNIVCDDAKCFLGYTLEEFEEKTGGTWSVYNRMGVEDGHEVNPEVLTIAGLNKQMEDDYWSAMTQSMNRPLRTGLAEFSAMSVKRGSMDYDETERRWYVYKENSNFEKDGQRSAYRLGDLDTVMAIDPAFTDRGMSSKTSRTAIGAGSMDADGNIYVIFGKRGFFSIMETFEHLFACEAKFRGNIRECIVESNAAQKVLKPLLDKESYERNQYVFFHAIPETGDKDARIRSVVGTPLAKGKIYICDPEAYVHFTEEQKIFPQAKYKKDFLDMMAKLIAALRRPMDNAEETFRDLQEAEFENATRSQVTGYARRYYYGKGIDFPDQREGVFHLHFSQARREKGWKGIPSSMA